MQIVVTAPKTTPSEIQVDGAQAQEWSRNSIHRTYVKLPAGVLGITLPTCVFSVGTYKMRDPPVTHAVLDAALQCGYRMVGKL